MEKISFVIPDKKESIINNIKNNTTENKHKNNTGYFKLCENVYSFENEIILNDKSMINIYNKGLKLRYENRIDEAIKVFLECEKQIQDKINNDELSIYYEIYVNLALLTSQTKENFELISKYYNSAIKFCPDRAEPYYYYSLYCKSIDNYDTAYEFLSKALNISYELANNKYNSIQHTSYGKHLYFELALICYKLSKYDEGLSLLNLIKDDTELSYIKKNIDEQIEKFINV